MKEFQVTKEQENSSVSFSFFPFDFSLRLKEHSCYIIIFSSYISNGKSKHQHWEFHHETLYFIEIQDKT